MLVAPTRNCGQLVGFDDRAGGVGRARDDEPRGRLGQFLEHRDGWLESRALQAVELDDAAAQRRQRVSIRRIARPGHDDGVPRVERSEEQQRERARRAGGDHHVVGVDGDAVPRAVILGDRATQRQNPQRLGVPEQVRIQGLASGAQYRLGRSRGGLTCSKREHVAVSARPLGRRGEHIHHVERLDHRSLRFTVHSIDTTDLTAHNSHYHTEYRRSPRKV